MGRARELHPDLQYHEFTLDHAIISPDTISDTDASKIDLSTYLGRIRLSVPLVSSPMDRVTGYRMAALMDKIGAIGTIHMNNSIDEQMAEVAKMQALRKDSQNPPQVLVAVNSRLETARERVEAANEAGVTGIIVDSRNMFSDHLKIAEYAKSLNPDLVVVLGNIVTGRVFSQAMERAGDYIDAFRVGMGTGEVCTTSERLKLGRAMGSALWDISAVRDLYEEKAGRHIALIADGGIKDPGHVLMALALGADMVMMGTELAGLDESPGEIVKIKGQNMKEIRGMGSAEVINERVGKERYRITGVPYPEGIKKYVNYKGDGEEWLEEFFGGLANSMAGAGMRDIKELQKEAYILPRATAISKGTS